MSQPGNINGMYKTFCTKYTHYAPDGNGRDKYIINNNGGLWDEGVRPIYESNMYFRPLPSKALPAPHKAATSFKYVSDGSGRDFYVTFNSGGLEAPYIPGSKHPIANFFESLRNNNRILKYKRHMSPREREQIKRSKSIQKILVDRLTWSTNKWKEMSHIYKRTSSFRRNNFELEKRSISNRSDSNSRGNLLCGRNTNSEAKIKRINPINSFIKNEYDDK